MWHIEVSGTVMMQQSTLESKILKSTFKSGKWCKHLVSSPGTYLLKYKNDIVFNSRDLKSTFSFKRPKTQGNHKNDGSLQFEWHAHNYNNLTQYILLYLTSIIHSESVELRNELKIIIYLLDQYAIQWLKIQYSR